MIVQSKKLASGAILLLMDNKGVFEVSYIANGFFLAKAVLVDQVSALILFWAIVGASSDEKIPIEKFLESVGFTCLSPTLENLSENLDVIFEAVLKEDFPCKAAVQALHTIFSNGRKKDA